MCGRFTIGVNETTLKDYLEENFTITTFPPSINVPRYNVAPSQEVLGIIKQTNSFEATLFNWGMHFKNDHKKQLINARMETITEKPIFKQSNRCIILADGFYEWHQTTKIPHYFHSKDKLIFAFAGLYHNSDKDHPKMSIVTKPANDLMAPVHHRMPVILNKQQAVSWLEGTLDLALLLDHENINLTAYPVSFLVNSTINDHHDLLKKTEQTSLFDL